MPFISTVAADVPPITRVAPTSTPEPSIGEKTCKKMGSGMAAGGSGGPEVRPTGGGVGVITALSMGATWGTGEGANSGISSNGARRAGARTVGEMGMESVRGEIASVTPPGPQAAKPEAKITTNNSPAKILSSETPLFLNPVPVLNYRLKSQAILPSREEY